MNEKILLIDDEELVRSSLGKLLVTQGYGVIPCADGEEAIARIQTERFDLVVCDVRMPRLDGIETLKAIRFFLKTHNLKTRPEILITGYADETAAKEAQKLKVAEYLSKPLDLRDFLERIREHLPA